MFGAELPIGMTARFKEKQAYYEKFDHKWSGKEAFDLIRECLKVVTDAGNIRPTYEAKAQQPQDASAIIQKLLKLDFDSIFGKIEKSDMYDSSKLDYQPLKFKWTKVTLGWYISLLWGNIFINYNSFAAKGILAEISFGLSVFKRQALLGVLDRGSLVQTLSRHLPLQLRLLLLYHHPYSARAIIILSI